MSIQALFREAMTLLGVVSAPLFLATLIVGVTIGILQAATQVNDPAMSALPRLAVAVAVCFFLGGWMMESLAGFLARALTQIAAGPR